MITWHEMTYGQDSCTGMQSSSSSLEDNNQKSVISSPRLCYFPLRNVIPRKSGGSFPLPDNITLSASHTDILNLAPSSGAVSDGGLFH